MASLWDSDSKFGFDGASAGGATATAPTPSAPASSPLQPARGAHKALLDPKGSGIFWVAAFAIAGLAMVTGELKVGLALKARGGK